MSGSRVSLVLSPGGRLSLAEDNDACELAPELARRLQAAFSRGAGFGLLDLGAREVGETLPPALGYWREFAAGIDSLVELLQGRFSKGVMERICRQRSGLFPSPEGIRFSCSCPDWASMCKHVAAVLYGVGSRLDDKPELLFRLRMVDEKELLAGAAAGLPVSRKKPAVGKVLEEADLSTVFGIDLASGPEPPPTTSGRRLPRKRGAKTAKRNVSRKRAKRAATGSRGMPRQDGCVDG